MYKIYTQHIKPIFLTFTECGLLPADFIFLLDSSGSETSTNFQKQVNFMKDFADRFTIGPNETQFSSVTFSTGVRNDFDLKENRNKQELTSAISRIHYMNGETETHLALNYARGHSIQRESTSTGDTTPGCGTFKC